MSSTNGGVARKGKDQSIIEVLRGSGRFGIVIAVTSASIGVIYGYDLGAIAAALLFIPNDFQVSTFETQAITSAVVLGQVFGAVFGGRIANHVGRKRALVAVAIGYVVFALLSGVAWSAWSLIAFRFLLGVTIGVSISVAPLFIGESAPAPIRGGLLATYQVANIAGIALAYFVGVALAGAEAWRIMLAASAVLAAGVLVIIARLPDTPRWYLMKGRREEAVDTMARADPTRDAEEAIADIEQDLEHEERGTFRELFSSPFRTAGLWVVVFGFLVQITGINAIVFYAPTFLKGVGFSGSTGPILGNAFVQLAGLAMAVTALSLVDRWGRRPVLMTGLGIMCVANVVMIVAFVIGGVPGLALAGIFLFVMGFDFGLGVMVWIYSSESLPSRLRGPGASALLASNLAANFVIAQFFLSIFGSLGGGGTFAIFLGFALFALVFVHRLAPETRGRELEEIRGYWENDAHWPAAAPTGPD